jgi:hypothetical protein
VHLATLIKSDAVVVVPTIALAICSSSGLQSEPAAAAFTQTPAQSATATTASSALRFAHFRTDIVRLFGVKKIDCSQNIYFVGSPSSRILYADFTLTFQFEKMELELLGQVSRNNGELGSRKKRRRKLPSFLSFFLSFFFLLVLLLVVGQVRWYS